MALQDSRVPANDSPVNDPQNNHFHENNQRIHGHSTTNNAHQLEPNILFYDNAIHYRKESTFSEYNMKMNLDGFKNFLYIILVISVGRLVLENVNSYGLKANPITWIETTLNDPQFWPLIYLSVLINVFALFSMLLERFYVFYLESMGRVTQQHLPESTTTFCAKNNIQTLNILRFKTKENEERIFHAIYMCHLLILLVVPIVFNWFVQCNPYLCGFLCLWYSTTFMKLYSFHQVNSWWRTGQVYEGRLQPSDKTNETLELYQGETLRAWNPSKLTFYPNNLTIQNVLLFLHYPTLCYQCNFPKKKSRNYPFMLRCLLELVFLIELCSVLSQQWVIIPMVENRMLLSNITVTEFLLRWTKMSLATITIWLVAFYCLFQSFLNLIAEVFLFADRTFYEDWWNSRTISQFWRKWNLPVHMWFKRHLFKPLLLRGYTHLQTTAIIFFLSGLFHEYLVSVPLTHLSIHFVLGMSGQVLLEAISIHLRSWHLANAFIWSSLILGQPMLIILYHNDVMNAFNMNTNMTTINYNLII